MTRPIVIGVALAGLLAAGLARADALPDGAAEPRDLLVAQARAVVEGDSGLFLSTFTWDTPEARAFLPTVGAFFEMIVVRRDFQEKLIKTYGLDALDKMGIGPAAGFKVLAKADVLARPQKAMIETNDDTARAESLFTGSALHLVKQHGRWFVDPTGGSPKNSRNNNPLTRGAAIAILKQLTISMQEAMPLIGQPGQTPETIQAAMEKKAKEKMAPR